MPKIDYLARKTPRVGKRVKKFLTSSHDARPKENFFFENCDLKSQFFVKMSQKVTIDVTKVTIEVTKVTIQVTKVTIFKKKSKFSKIF